MSPRVATAIAVLAASACLATTPSATAQPGTPAPDHLERATMALDSGEYAVAEAASREALVASLEKQTQDNVERAEAYRILGLSLFHLGRHCSNKAAPCEPEAERAVLEYFKLIPDGKLDPNLHDETVVAFFEKVRFENEQLIAGYRPEKEKRRFAVNLVPPFGQFQNKQPIKGAIVGGLELALVAANVTTFFVLRSWCEDDGTCPGREKSAERLQVVNVAAGLAFGGVYLYGVIDGWRGYRKWQRQQSSVFEVSFQLVPRAEGGALATVGGRF